MNAGNLAELLQMLQGTQKNWVAHIALPEAVASGSGEPWQAQLTVIEGKVTCQVWSSVDKRMLHANDGAIRWLATLPRLSWSLEPIVPPMASTRAFQGSQATLVQQVPKRTTHVEKRMMNTWSRKQRQVFALVDGSRTSEHIATMLQQPPLVVEKVLDSPAGDRSHTKMRCFEQHTRDGGHSLSYSEKGTSAALPFEAKSHTLCPCALAGRPPNVPLAVRYAVSCLLRGMIGARQARRREV